MFINLSTAGADSTNKIPGQTLKNETRMPGAFEHVFNDVSGENMEQPLVAKDTEIEVLEEVGDPAKEASSDSEIQPLRKMDRGNPDEKDSDDAQVPSHSLSETRSIPKEQTATNGESRKFEPTAAGIAPVVQNSTPQSNRNLAHGGTMAFAGSSQNRNDNVADTLARIEPAKAMSQVRPDIEPAMNLAPSTGRIAQTFGPSIDGEGSPRQLPDSTGRLSQSVEPSADIAKENTKPSFELVQSVNRDRPTAFSSDHSRGFTTPNWQSDMAISVKKTVVPSPPASGSVDGEGRNEPFFTARSEVNQLHTQTSVGLADTAKTINPTPSTNLASSQALLQDPSEKFVLNVSSEEVSHDTLTIRDGTDSTGPINLQTTSSVAQQNGQLRFSPALVADSLARAPERPVEISINPEELGRVRMALSTTESGITLTILAERPETLDLMRRNIEDLAAEFRRLGYEDIGFQFGAGQDQERLNSESKSSDQSNLNTEQMNTIPEHTGQWATTGLDMRL